jgi:hypothetical protein
MTIMTALWRGEGRGRGGAGAGVWGGKRGGEKERTGKREKMIGGEKKRGHNNTVH